MQAKENIKNIIPYKPGVLKEGAVKLASNENPFGASPKAKKAISAVIGSAGLYPDGASIQLRQALAERYGLAIDNFIVGNGSDEIFLFITGAFIDKGDQMITSECTFSEYAFATKLFGGEVVTAPMKDGRYQLKELAKKVTPKTKLVFIANPNNPTGTYVRTDEFEQFMRDIPETVLVIMDEAYYEYVQAADYPDTLKLLGQYKNLLITRTFSKIYGLAGLRVGYAIGDAEIIGYLNKAREPFNVNSVAQAAAVAALQDKTFVKKSVTNNNSQKAFLYQELTKRNLQFFPSEGNFIFVYLPVDCDTAFQKLMDFGVTIRPMKSFGQNNAIRVTIGTPKQNKLFLRCLDTLLGGK
jgi:histidinol-phosphate aminotransferase